MAYSTIQNIYPQVAKAQKKTRDLMTKALSQTVKTTYETGKLGRGTGEKILLIGGTGYVGHALIPELLQRNYRPVVLSRSHNIKEEFPDAEVVVGDVCQAKDVAMVFAKHDIEAVISLISSRRPNDEEECFRADYLANTNVIAAAAKDNCKQFIHISDYGCYRPELLPQVYKLQVEGELMGQSHGKIDYTIIRPTSYYPYLAINFSDVKNGEKYRIFDHGEWAMYNPISREDLSEFIVNQLFNRESLGKTLPVGGPWTEDNLCTLKSAGEKIFEVLGMGTSFKIVPIKSWERKIKILKSLGSILPMFRRIAFYLEAAKYWSTVNHFAPAYGQDTFKQYLEKLKKSGYNAGTFRERMKAGTALIPNHI